MNGPYLESMGLSYQLKESTVRVTVRGNRSIVNSLTASDIVVVGIGGIIGAVAMYLIIFFIYSSSNVIRDGENVEEMIGMDIIGIVPDFATSKSHEKRYGAYYSAGGRKNG